MAEMNLDQLVQSILGMSTGYETKGKSSSKSKVTGDPQASKYLLDYMNKIYNTGVGAAKSQAATGKQQINAELLNFLSSLGQPQAYSGTPLVQLNPEQQNLSQALMAHGASTEPAQSTMANQQAISQQYAELARRNAEQLNQSQQAYYGDIQNAARTSATMSQQQLLLNTLAVLGNLLSGSTQQRQNIISTYGGPAR